MKTLILCMASFLVFGSMAYAAETGKQLYGSCIGCHGADGGKTPMKSPPIKGQSSAELDKMLQGYFDGSYGGANKKIMVNIMQKYTDAQRKALADYMGGF